VGLLQYERSTGLDRVRPRPCDVGSVHLALTVDDLDAVLEASTDFGWRAAGTPQKTSTGPRASTRFAYMRDQDGTTIELIQPRPV
jgi:catechol 2,3-dioxygenase-like lactoylglutathione lyase family enzyme